MNFFTQVGIFTKTLQFLNAKVKAILYQHFTLIDLNYLPNLTSLYLKEQKNDGKFY